MVTEVAADRGNGNTKLIKKSAYNGAVYPGAWRTVDYEGSEGNSTCMDPMFGSRDVIGRVPSLSKVADGIGQSRRFGAGGTIRLRVNGTVIMPC